MCGLPIHIESCPMLCRVPVQKQLLAIRNMLQREGDGVTFSGSLESGQGQPTTCLSHIEAPDMDSLLQKQAKELESTQNAKAHLCLDNTTKTSSDIGTKKLYLSSTE
ncbi:hypothetical protein BTVI_60709 [Pitangus sulphuratus]|nr:hypothetical protein BTVI_60709 [Pitangus sulphuratus]